MKRVLALLLAVAMVVSFTACGAGRTVKPTEYPTATPPAGETVKPMPTPQTSEKVDVGVAEFAVEKTVCKYKDGNVAILHVENVTDIACTVTINVKYLGEDGNSRGTEQKKFEGFPGNWDNYFVFEPQKTFADIEYEIKATKFDGLPAARLFDCGNTISTTTTFGHVDKNGEFTIPFGDNVGKVKEVVCITFNIDDLMITGACNFNLDGTIVVFDAYGELIYIGTRNKGNMGTDKPISFGLSAHPKVPTDTPWKQRDEYILPWELANVTGFFALESFIAY